MSNANTGEFRALGFERDPFPPSDTHMDFFARGGREKIIEALANLRELGRPLIVVHGPTGVGKSTCFHALLQALPPGARVARVTAGVFLSAKSLLQSVARAMGLAVDAEESRDGLRQRLRGQLKDLVGADEDCVVLVDDADQLEEDALHELVEMARLGVGNHRVRVMLFAESRFLDLLRGSSQAETAEPLLHEVRLEPYTLNEMRGYLQFRMTKAGLTGHGPFSEDDYQRIHRKSGGLAGLANEAANEALRQHMRSPLLRQGPMMAAGAAAALLLVIGLALALGGGDDEAVEAADAAPLPLPTLEGSGTTAAGTLVRSEPPRITSAPDTTTAQAASGDETAAVAMVRAGASETEAGAWLEPSPASPQPMEVTAGSRMDAEEPVRAATRAAVVATRPEVEPAPAVQAATVVEPEPEPEPEPVQVARSAPAEPASPLLQLDPDHFTMQVLGTSSREKARDWVAQRSDRERFHVYERLRNGDPWFVVVYGDFPERDAANRALPQVVAATGVSQPWIRRLADVQAEIRD